MPGIRVIAVSSKSSVRRRLREALRRDPDLRLLGLASDNEAGAEMVTSLRPDVALWDLGYGTSVCGHDPLSTELLSAIGCTRVLLCGRALDQRQAVALLALGLWGAIPADSDDDRLISAIRSVSRGELWIERKVLSEAFQAMLRANTVQRHGDPHLSARENEIAASVSNGLTNKEIAKSLGISDKTVKTHVHRILHKLHLRNRVLLAMTEPKPAPPEWEAGIGNRLDQAQMPAYEWSA